MAAPSYVWSSFSGSINYTDTSPVLTGEDCTTNHVDFDIEGYPIPSASSGAGIIVASASGLSGPNRVILNCTTVNMGNDLPLVLPQYDPLGFTFDLHSIAYACISGAEYSSDKEYGFFWVPDQKPIIERACNGTCHLDITIPAAYWVKRVVLKYYMDGGLYVNSIYDSGNLLGFKPGSNTILLFPETTITDTSGLVSEHRDVYVEITQYIDTNPNNVGGTARLTPFRNFLGYKCSCGVSKRRCLPSIVASRKRQVVPIGCQDEVLPPTEPPPTTEIPDFLTYYWADYDATIEESFNPAPWEFGSEHDHDSYGEHNSSNIPGIVTLDASHTSYIVYDEVFVMPAGTRISYTVMHETGFGPGSSVTMENFCILEVSKDLSSWTVLKQFSPTTTNGYETWTDGDYTTTEDMDIKYVRFKGKLHSSGMSAPLGSPAVYLNSKTGPLMVFTP